MFIEKLLFSFSNILSNSRVPFVFSLIKIHLFFMCSNNSNINGDNKGSHHVIIISLVQDLYSISTICLY